MGVVLSWSESRFILGCDVGIYPEIDAITGQRVLTNCSIVHIYGQFRFSSPLRNIENPHTEYPELRIERTVPEAVG